MENVIWEIIEEEDDEVDNENPDQEGVNDRNLENQQQGEEIPPENRETAATVQTQTTLTSNRMNQRTSYARLFADDDEETREPEIEQPASTTRLSVNSNASRANLNRLFGDDDDDGDGDTAVEEENREPQVHFNNDPQIPQNGEGEVNGDGNPPEGENEEENDLDEPNGTTFYADPLTRLNAEMQRARENLQQPDTNTANLQPQRNPNAVGGEEDEENVNRVQQMAQKIQRRNRAQHQARTQAPKTQQTQNLEQDLKSIRNALFNPAIMQQGQNGARFFEEEEEEEVINPATQKDPTERKSEKTEEDLLANLKKTDLKAQTEAQKAKEENREALERASAELFKSKVETFNKMYGTKLNADEFAKDLSDAWDLMRYQEGKEKEGKQMLSNLFGNVLKQAFDVEKDASYKEHRIPEYADIIKSSNELLRVGMFAHTDLYHSPKSAALFDPTTCGGMNAKEMAALIETKDGLWSMDQKSDEAWEIQSQEAKSLADEWLKLPGNQPYEKMITEMNALAAAKDRVDRKEALTKLTAAEWLLLNNDKMMIDNPEDPLNKMPNWGTRYWKAITNAREALGIEKHTSMRDIIQGEYAECAKPAGSAHYNERQIEDFVLDPDFRALDDSMQQQKQDFETRTEAIRLNSAPKKDPNVELKDGEIRKQMTVEEEDQRRIMKEEVKEYNFITDPEKQLTLENASINI